MPAAEVRVERVDRLRQTTDFLKLVATKSSELILFYSCGKDSIANLDLCAPHFKKIYLVQMYFVENLEHINKFLQYAQTKYPNVQVISKEHWTMTHLKRSGVYQVPSDKNKLKKLQDIDNEVREETGCNWTAYGMKKSDSLNRNLFLSNYPESGMWNEVTNKIYPLANWKNNEVLSYINLRKLPKPIAYSKNKKSQGVGFNKDCFLYLREYYPGDLLKIYEKFPLSKAILAYEK